MLDDFGLHLLGIVLVLVLSLRHLILLFRHFFQAPLVVLLSLAGSNGRGTDQATLIFGREVSRTDRRTALLARGRTVSLAAHMACALAGHIQLIPARRA